MRDRTRSRNYSAEGDEFRRVHERHRRWGLARRHALKRCRLQGCSAECAAVGLHDFDEGVPPLIWPAGVTRAPRPSGPGVCRDVAAARDLPPGGLGGGGASADQASLADRAPTVTAEAAPPADSGHRAMIASLACSTGQGTPADRSVADVCAEPADHTELVDRAEPVDRMESVDRAEPVDGVEAAPRTEATEWTIAAGRVESSQHHRTRLIRDSRPAATSPTAARSATPRAPRAPRPRGGPEKRRGKSGSTRNNKPENARPPPVARSQKDLK